MNFKHFLYNLTSIDDFLRKWQDVTKSGNDLTIESFFDDDKTHYMIKKIKEKSHHYHGLHFTLQNYIIQGKSNLVKKSVKAGLDINYRSLPLFSSIFRTSKKEEINNMGQAFLDLGFNVNQLTIHPKNALAPIHYTLAELKHLDVIYIKTHYSGININGKRRKPFYSDGNDKELTSISPTYKLFKTLIEKGIDLNQERLANLIPFAIETTSKIILKDVLTMEGITREYIKKGMEEARERNIISSEIDNYIEEVYIILEKKQLEEQCQAFIPNQKQVTKKLKI